MKGFSQQWIIGLTFSVSSLIEEGDTTSAPFIRAERKEFGEDRTQT